MKLIPILLLLLISFIGYACNDQAISSTKIANNDPCDGPDPDMECAFGNMPANVSSVMQIAKSDEPGERLVISGKFLHKDGVTPFAGVLIYVYHTDRNGRYSKKGNETGVQRWHGYLHGWAKTDESGYYEIQSIRPAQYPSRDQPAHIHATVKEPGKPAYNISDFVFKGDPLLSGHTASSNSVGGDGVVSLEKDEKNTWRGKRDVILKN